MAYQNVSISELAKIPYFDQEELANRGHISVLPFWDGHRWFVWPSSKGVLFEMHPLDVAESDYLAKHPQRPDDLRISFVEFMWQRGGSPGVHSKAAAIREDFHNLFSSASKLRVLHQWAKSRKGIIPQRLVSTELEYILIVSRSIFDLLYETISDIWSKTTLLETSKHPQTKLPEKLSKFLLQGERNTPKKPGELIAKYGAPAKFAEELCNQASFFCFIRSLRDSIVHGLGESPWIFCLDHGFGVHAASEPFARFKWKPDHFYNDELVSLFPWVSDIIVGTIDACNKILFAFASEVQFSKDLAPGYHLFIRCESSDMVVDLVAAARGELTWWRSE